MVVPSPSIIQLNTFAPSSTSTHSHSESCFDIVDHTKTSIPKMGPTSTLILADHHGSNDYDQEAPSSFRRPYNYSDPELSSIYQGLSLSDPPDTTNDPIRSEVRDVECWSCRKCFMVFHTAESFSEHCRMSALHITCEHCDIAEDFASLQELRQHCCDHHFGCPYCEGATVWKTAATLDRHYRTDHFSCRFCIFVQLFASHEDLQAHYRASHKTCPLCPNPQVLRYEEELREHCLREHFGCPCCDTATYSDDEESLKTHISLNHFTCYLCKYQTVFTSREDFLAHQRIAHGVFDCRFCCPQQPRIIWPPPWREHMERCYYPNPCTDDFYSDSTLMIDYCDLCKETFEPQNRKVHLLFSHFCQDCARYGTIFKMHRDDHFSECSLDSRRSNKEYDNSQSTRESGRQHWQRKAQQNEWARESFRRQHENFKTRAKEPRAQSPPLPPPIQKPQEPAPLDIYTILKVSPQSSPDDTKRAIRLRRIETHPDKRKKLGLSKEEEVMIDEEAKLVGMAADILLDPEKRQKHEEQMQAWKMRYGQ